MDVTTESSCAYLASGLKTSIVKTATMKSITGSIAVTLKSTNSVWNTSSFENTVENAEGNMIDSSQAKELRSTALPNGQQPQCPLGYVFLPNGHRQRGGEPGPQK